MGESLQPNSPAYEKKGRIGILENLQTGAEEYTLPGRHLCTEWRKKIADLLSKQGATQSLIAQGSSPLQTMIATSDHN